MKVKAVLNKRAKANKKHLVSIYINVNNTRASISTGIEVKKMTGLTKAEADSIDNHITNIKKFLIDNPKARARDAVRDFKGDKESNMILVILENEIERLKGLGRLGNAKVYNTVKNSIEKTVGNVALEDIDYGFIKDYSNHLQKQGLSKNSQSNYLRTFRAVYNEAAKRKELTKDPWRLLEMPKTNKNVRKLSVKDIREIYKSKGEARDVFMLSYFLCGVNLIDICFNDWEIKKGRFEVERKKVTKAKAIVSVRIEPEIKSLLNKIPKYDNFHGYQSFLRRTNEKLIKLGRKLKIDEKVTTYTARYSWANIARDQKHPELIIGEMMGHMKKGVTEGYLGQAPEEIKDKINRQMIDLIV